MQETVLIQVLQTAKEKVMSAIKSGKTFTTGKQFEDSVYNTIQLITLELGIKCDLNHSGPQTFPDIVIDSFGVEVKLSQKDDWKSIGNSIREGTKIQGLDKIFLFFLKQGGTPDIRYGEYQDYLADVVVTHSPRYAIDMNLRKGTDIITQMGLTYKEFTGKAALQKVRQHFKSLGKDVWWITPTEHTDEEVFSKAYARRYKDLTAEEKFKFMAKSFILFPKIFSSSTTKFEQVSVYLLENFDCLNSNLRDKFSAGGKWKIDIKGNTYTLPKIFQRLFKHAKAIDEELKSIDIQEVRTYWEDKTVSRKDLLNRWIKAVKEYSGISAVESIYQAGLER